MSGKFNKLGKSLMKLLIKAFVIISSFLCHAASADIFWLWRENQLPGGETNWQYVANTSSSVLILALSFTAIKLFLSRRQVRMRTTPMATSLLRKPRSELRKSYRKKTTQRRTLLLVWSISTATSSKCLWKRSTLADRPQL